MIERILKRDGRVMPFDQTKILTAMLAAAKAAGDTDINKYEKIASDVTIHLNSEYIMPSVEEIQDVVEEMLRANNLERVFECYHKYRENRTREREKHTQVMQTMEELTISEAADLDVKRENANIDGDTAMGTMLKYGSETAKQYYDMCILKPEHAKAHREGDIHIHDLDFLTLTTTCCQIDLTKLFTGGFSTGHGFLREPNSIHGYSALACIAIQSNQNDQHGGQSIPMFDYDMAAGVRKSYRTLYRDNMIKILDIEGVENSSKLVCDTLHRIQHEHGVIPAMNHDNGYAEYELEELSQILPRELIEKTQKLAYKYTDKEIDRATFQAMEALVHNLNTMHSRAGAQIPFSSLNYGTDTSLEGRLVIKNLLLATEAGLGNGETAIFPIHIFKVKEGVNYNEGDPNYDLFKLACKVSAERLFPNFAFLDAPYNKQYYVPGHPETEAVYMGCIDKDETIELSGNISATMPIGKCYDAISWLYDHRGDVKTLMEG